MGEVKDTPSQHKICKTIVVDCCNLAPNNSIEYSSLVDVNGSQSSESTMIIPQQAMNTKQAHNAEITQDFEDICPTVVIITISCCESEISIFFLVKDLEDH